MTFLELAKKVLKEENKPMSSDEIWNIANVKGYIVDLNSCGKTPSATLGARLHTSVKDSDKSEFQTIGARPKKFILKGNKLNEYQLQKAMLIDESKKYSKKINYLEKDLHPILTYFSYSNLNCYSKTINHPQSTKKEFGEWVHSDMIGCYFPIEEWKPEVFELSSSIGNISIKLFFFEIKREISFSILRESFFQAV